VALVPSRLHGPLKAATRLSIPVALAVLVGVFLVAQAQLGRRDPKLVEAPHDRDEDGLSFS
jgi:hypothetical protein